VEQVTNIDSEPQGPYHAGWQVYRDSYRDHTDEYVPADHWTGIKRIESIAIPVWSMAWGYWARVHRTMAVVIRVRVHGKRRGPGLFGGRTGRLRPTRWYAEVEFGSVRTWQGPNGRCNSVADAIRQAEKSEALEELVREVVRKVYRDPQYRASYHRITGPDSCEEFVVGLSALFEPFVDLPNGDYVAFSWHRAYPRGGQPEWRQAVTLITRSGGSSSSGSSPDDHKHWVRHFPEWLVQPQEER